MNPKVIQNVLWLSFLIYYCASKFLAGFQAYSHAYAIQVAIIVLATAIIPYYATHYAARYFEKLKAAIMMFVPSALAMGGYALFFFVFIAPNFPEIAAAQVILRGLLPGIVISVILMLPIILESVGRRRAAAS